MEIESASPSMTDSDAASKTKGSETKWRKVGGPVMKRISFVHTLLESADQAKVEWEERESLRHQEEEQLRLDKEKAEKKAEKHRLKLRELEREHLKFQTAESRQKVEGMKCFIKFATSPDREVLSPAFYLHFSNNLVDCQEILGRDSDKGSMALEDFLQWVEKTALDVEQDFLMCQAKFKIKIERDEEIRQKEMKEAMEMLQQQLVQEEAQRERETAERERMILEAKLEAARDRELREREKAVQAAQLAAQAADQAAKFEQEATSLELAQMELKLGKKTRRSEIQKLVEPDPDKIVDELRKSLDDFRCYPSVRTIRISEQNSQPLIRTTSNTADKTDTVDQPAKTLEPPETLEPEPVPILVETLNERPNTAHRLQASTTNTLEPVKSKRPSGNNAKVSFFINTEAGLVRVTKSRKGVHALEEESANLEIPVFAALPPIQHPSTTAYRFHALQPQLRELSPVGRERTLQSINQFMPLKSNPRMWSTRGRTKNRSTQSARHHDFTQTAQSATFESSVASLPPLQKTRRHTTGNMHTVSASTPEAVVLPALGTNRGRSSSIPKRRT